MKDSSTYEELSKEELIAVLIEHSAKLEQKDLEIDKLYCLLIQAKKNLYGSKSEKQKISENQLNFSFSEAKEEITSSNTESTIEVKSHNRKKREKRILPEGIERERIEYDLDLPLCPTCGKDMAVIGEEVSEELEFIPARFKVFEHARLKRACSCCKNKVFIPSLPPEVKPLERRAAGAGLLSQILVSKYCDHNPLYRQEQIFKRHGVILPRRLLCGWVAAAVEVLMPIYEELKKEILIQSYVQADETTLKVQDKSKQGKLHTGYLWAVHAPPNKVFFHYGESRASEVAISIFEGYRGRVQTDAYAGYNKIFLPDTCERIACMAHIRRKFIEASASSKRTECAKIISQIAQLYKSEKLIKGLDHLERYEIRKKKSFGIMKKLYTLIRQEKQKVLPESPYAKALNYAWEQGGAMLQFFKDGKYEIDNNLIENQMRPVALGRKNYLFAGSHEGARRAAVLYSLINSCKLNKVSPYDYLQDVLRRIHTPGVKVSQLLPHNWASPVNM